MPISAILGYGRAFARGPSLDEQREILLVSGVEARFIYLDEILPTLPDSRAMFGELLRALRKADVLAVPFLAAFARNRSEVMDGLAALETRGVMFWSIADDIDTRTSDPRQLYKLAAAERRAQRIWNRERTDAATHAARRTHRMGRRPKLSARQLAAARTAWTDCAGEASAKTNDQLAAELGLSAGRLWALFGARRPRE